MLISEALEGKFHRSYNSRREGIIQYAELRKDICGLNENVFAYVCQVRPHWNGTGFPKPDFYTTVYVALDEE
jgi:hypothetical protein